MSLQWCYTASGTPNGYSSHTLPAIRFRDSASVGFVLLVLMPRVTFAIWHLSQRACLSTVQRPPQPCVGPHILPLFDPLPTRGHSILYREFDYRAVGLQKRFGWSASVVLAVKGGVLPKVKLEFAPVTFALWWLGYSNLGISHRVSRCSEV